MRQCLLILVLLMTVTYDVSSRDRVFGVVDSKGEIIVPFEYEYIRPSEDRNGLYSAKKGGLWGVIDTVGKTVIPFRYAEPPYFRAQYIMITFDREKYGAIDYCGNQIVPPEYCYVNSGDNGIIYAEKDSVFHIFDLSGREILPPVYTGVDYYTEKLIPVRLNEKWGLVDTDNNTVLPFEFDGIHSTYRLGSDFLMAYKCRVEYVDGCEICKYETSVYNTRMEKVTGGIYDDHLSFGKFHPDSMLLVRKNGKMGLIKLDGRDTEIIPPIYKYIDFYRNGLGIIQNFDGMYALVLNSGEITPFIYSYATISYPSEKETFEVFQEDLIDGKPANSRRGTIDRHGRVIDSLRSKLEFYIDGIPVYLDVRGRINDDTYICYTYIPDEEGNYYIVIDGDPYDGKKFGLMNAKGEILVPPVYDGMDNQITNPYYSDGWVGGTVMTYLPENHVLILKDDLWSVMDVSTGKYVLKDFERINGVYNDQYIVGKSIVSSRAE